MMRDARYWHKADMPTADVNVRFWGVADIMRRCPQRPALLVAIRLSLLQAERTEAPAFYRGLLIDQYAAEHFWGQA